MQQHRYNYIRRSGRMTKAQTRGYDEGRDRYRSDLSAWNKQTCALGVEIGFGMGQGLSAWAEAVSDWSLLGIELYRPGVGALAAQLTEKELTNVTIVEEPAQEIFRALDADSIDEVRILFPDPWPKKRHAKRRLVQPEFMAQVAAALKPSGLLKLATDWDPYAQWMREVLDGEAGLKNILDRVTEDGQVTALQGSVDLLRPAPTKFETRGRNLGHRIHDLVYVAGINSATTESK